MLTQFVPHFIARQVAQNPSPLLSPRAEAWPAAVLFADIVGFTTLTEQLAEQGPAGAETLTQILNDYFGQLIEHITRHGGDVLKFAGDALLAVWPATPAATHLPETAAPTELLFSAVLAAAHCAQTLQNALRAYRTSDGQLLALHIGIGVGEVVIAQLGGVNGRWELLVTGTAVAQVSLAEAKAGPGAVVLSPEAWALLEPIGKGWALANGYMELQALDPAAAPALHAVPTVDLAAESERALRAYIPGAILARLAAGQRDWLAELRRVTILFVTLPGYGQTLLTNEGLIHAQTVMQSLQIALYRFEGSLNKLNVDDKGVTFVAALGLPPFAHEDDAARGVLAALAMQETLRGQGLQSAIGVTTARVFCGAVGGAARREYTMIGDGVNLAARLMQATIAAGPSGGGIMCDAATREAAETRIEFETLESIWVKGKAELVEVARPKGERRRFLRANIGLVGREAERALLVDALHNLVAQANTPNPATAQVIILEAEAGLGKTRLVEEARLQAERLGVTVFSGAGGAVEKNTPYFAWREVFNDLFDMALFEGPAAQKRHLLLSLGVQRLQRAPLLKAVLPNLDLPDNGFTRALVGQARADNTRDLLVQLLQASIQRSPKLLILEDAHWLDSASWHLALAASQAARPWLLVIAARPLPEPLPPDYAALRQLPGARVVKLTPLAANDTLQLVMRRLGVEQLPPTVAQFIRERAEGNPFFSEELAYALRDAEVLRIENGRCTLAPGVDPNKLPLPDTVDGVITSRIDHLSPAHQLALKIASVIGRVFQYRILHDVYPIPADQQHLRDYLQHLHRLDLTPLEAPEPDLAYTFKHLITQEVAYNLLPFAQRQSLHRAVAEWHEQMYAADLTPYYAPLAYHWRNAGAVEQALSYLHRAAEQAIRLSAYRETEGFCAQALSMLGFDDGAGRQLSAESRALAAQLAYHSGVALWGVGEFVRARQRLTASLSLARSLTNVQLQVDALTRLGWVLTDVGEYVGAEAAFEEGLRLAREHQYQAGLAQVLVQYGFLFFNRSDFANAHQMFEESRVLSQALGNEAGEGRALNMLGILAMYQGALDEGRAYFTRYLEIARTNGERRGIAVALMNLGETEYRVGRYPEARQHIAESLEMMQALGERINVATDAVLLGLVHCETQEVLVAAQYFLQGVTVAAEIKAWPRVLFALTGTARLFLLLARPTEAAQLLGCALRHPATNADIANTAEPLVDQLRQQFDAAALESHMAAGADKPLAALIAQTEAALRAVVTPKAG